MIVSQQVSNASDLLLLYDIPKNNSNIRIYLRWKEIKLKKLEKWVANLGKYLPNFLALVQHTPLHPNKRTLWIEWLSGIYTYNVYLLVNILTDHTKVYNALGKNVIHMLVVPSAPLLRYKDNSTSNYLFLLNDSQQSSNRQVARPLAIVVVNLRFRQTLFFIFTTIKWKVESIRQRRFIKK